MFKPGRRLWLTEDKESVVEDGDPRAAFLLSAGPDDEIEDADAVKFGLKEPAAPVRSRLQQDLEDGNFPPKPAEKPAAKKEKATSKPKAEPKPRATRKANAAPENKGMQAEETENKGGVIETPDETQAVPSEPEQHSSY